MIELRYPFDSLFDFFSGGYLFQDQALHLSFGFIAILIAIMVCLMRFRDPIAGLIGFYFLSPVYSNPCYGLFGIGFPELLGSFVFMLVLFTRPSAFLPRGAFEKNTYIAISIIISYTIIILLFNQNQNGGHFGERIFVFGKPVLLAFLFAAALNLRVVRDDAFFRLVSIVVFSEFIAYFYQLFIFLEGIVPYGTYPAAGIDTFVSFGGTSNERGHLAKFFNPLLPIILFYNRSKASYLLLIAFFLVAFSNLSASGYCFLLIELFFVALFFRTKLSKSLGSLFFCFIMLIFVAILFDALAAIFNKIYNLAILGDESEAGGRSLDTFMMYIQSFPFGIGYSGSTYRIADGLPEINSGFFAFLSQLSVVGFFLIVAFLTNIYVIIRRSLRIAYKYPEFYFIISGVLAMPLIFFADLLWFVPTIWLPLIYTLSASQKD